METTQTEFAPEIEARRSDYQQLAEAFVTLAEMHADKPFPGRLEVSVAHITAGIDAHVKDLFDGLDLYDPRFWRQFYPDLRLMLDQLELERANDRRAVT